MFYEDYWLLFVCDGYKVLEFVCVEVLYLILLDVMMFGLLGFDVCCMLKV